MINRTRLRALSLGLLTALAAGPAAQAQLPAPAPRDDLPALYAGAANVAIQDRTMYLSGGPGQVGVATGALAILDAATGAPLPPHASVEGEITAIAGDGAGGWFIAGDLVAVAGASVGRIAHLSPERELIELPVSVTGSSVRIRRLAVFGDGLVIAGDFSRINGADRAGLAAIDIATGELLPWTPEPDGAVIDLAVAGDTLYVGGGFNIIGGAGPVRVGAASFTGPDFQRTAWAPVAEGAVRSIEVDGGVAYLAGRIALHGEPLDTQVIAVDAETGAPTGFRVPGFPLSSRVNDMLVHRGALYIAGNFDPFGGAGRSDLAAADLTTGAILPFSVTVGAPGSSEVLSLALTDQGLALCGQFTQINGKDRRGLAMVDPVSGATLAWNPMLTHDCAALAGAGGSAVAAAGKFAIVGGEARNSSAAIDLDTGELLPWEVAFQKRSRDTSFSVTGMIATEQRIYLSGTFEKIDGFVVNGLAAVSPHDGALDITFDHAITPTALVFGFADIARVPGVIAARFGTILYGLDEATGIPIWSIENVNFTGRLAADPEHGRFYVCGRIEQATPPEVRERFAEIDAATGKLTDWNPRPDNRVQTVAVWKDKLIVGGDFRAIGGEIRPKLAVFERDPGERRLASAPLWEFALGASDSVDSVTVAADLMLMTGALTEIRGARVTNFATLLLPRIEPLEWAPPDQWRSVRALTDREVVLRSTRWHYGERFIPFLAVVPIDSPCRADLTGDGLLDFFDFLAFQNLFAAGDLRADFTGDGVLDFFDFLAFQNEFAAGCP